MNKVIKEPYREFEEILPCLSSIIDVKTKFNNPFNKEVIIKIYLDFDNNTPYQKEVNLCYYLLCSYFNNKNYTKVNKDLFRIVLDSNIVKIIYKDLDNNFNSLEFNVQDLKEDFISIHTDKDYFINRIIDILSLKDNG